MKISNPLYGSLSFFTVGAVFCLAGVSARETPDSVSKEGPPPAEESPAARTGPERGQVITLDGDLKPIPLGGITLIKDTRVHPGDVMTPTIAPVEGVHVLGGLQDPPAREELETRLRSGFLGKELTFGGLEEMVKLIEGHYVSHGRQLTHVFVPNQLMSDKVLIAVLEGRVTQTGVTDTGQKKPTWWNRWYSHPYDLAKVKARIIARSGDVQDLQPSRMNSVLDELNQSPWTRLNRPGQHPFLRVNASYSPVEDKLGETEVKLQIEQARPLRFFLGYDNTLTDLLGTNRVHGGFVWSDAFGLGLDHQLSLQVFSGLEKYVLTGFALNYEIPWKEWHQHTDIYTAYSESTAGLLVAGVPSDISGNSFVAGFRHFYELPDLVSGGEIIHGGGLTRDPGGRLSWLDIGKRDRQSFGIFHEVGAGLDYKTTDNNLEFGGATVTANKAEVVQLALEYNLRQTDVVGETNLGWKNYFGIGGSSDADLGALRAGAKADYWYTKAELDREQDLPCGSMLHARLQGQYSANNLLQSEELGIGGYDSVRGYQERVFNADIGWLASLELYTPPMRPMAHCFPEWGWMDELRFLVFTDWGSGHASDENASDPFDDKRTLGAVGVGLRYNVNDNLRIRLDYGWQLNALPVAPFGPYARDARSNQVHAGVVFTF